MLRIGSLGLDAPLEQLPHGSQRCVGFRIRDVRPTTLQSPDYSFPDVFAQSHYSCPANQLVFSEQSTWVRSARSRCALARPASVRDTSHNEEPTRAYYFDTPDANMSDVTSCLGKQLLFVSPTTPRFFKSSRPSPLRH